MRIFWIIIMTISGYLYTQTNWFQEVRVPFLECSSERDVFFAPYSSEHASAFLQQRYPRAQIVSIEKDLIPYLKMHVKCLIKGGAPREYTLLASLQDGEIVIEAKKWSKTKGFGTCIKAGLKEETLSVLRQIMENNGRIHKKQLISESHDDTWTDSVIDDFAKNNLIFIRKQYVFFHGESIRPLKTPYTSYPEFTSCLSKMSQKSTPAQFSPQQITRFIEAFFQKEHLAVMKHKLVFLPVYVVAYSVNDRPRILYYNGVTGLEYTWSD